MQRWEVATLVLVILALASALTLVLFISIQVPRYLTSHAAKYPPPLGFLPVDVASVQHVDMNQRPWPLIDGYVVQPSERVLLKNQEDSRENGIWVAPVSMDSSWKRAPDLCTASHVAEGTQVYISRGVKQAEQTFVLRRLSKHRYEPPGQCEIYFVPILQHLLGTPVPQSHVLQVDERGMAKWWVPEAPHMAASQSPIPTIIHMLYGFWDDEDGLRLAEQWREINAFYTVKLWTPADCEELIHAKFPHWMAWYHDVPKSIMKVDLMKWLILYHMGGIYLDMDIVPHVLPNPLTLQRMWLVIESMMSEHEIEALQSELEPGPRLGVFAIASVQRHPFVHFMLNHIARAKSLSTIETDYQVVAATGSDALTLVYRQYGIDFVDMEVSDVPSWLEHQRHGAWRSARLQKEHVA